MTATKAFLQSIGSDRVVIPHVDDVGMCHGSNAAFFELAETGLVTCGAVMVPAPWFQETCFMASTRPWTDLGVHLTLTSEWPHYRWGPISTVSRHSGLIDPQGYFWRNCRLLKENLVAEAVEIELRCQIDRALAMGLDITHLDAHMGAAMVAEVLEITLRLGQEYGLPVLLPRSFEKYMGMACYSPQDDLSGIRTAIKAMDQRGHIVIDHFQTSTCAPSPQSLASYVNLMTELPNGITFLALHCSTPGDFEIIIPDRAYRRTDDYHSFKTPQLHSRIRDLGIKTIGMRILRDHYRQDSAKKL